MKETIADVSSASPSSERMRGLWVNGVKKGIKEETDLRKRMNFLIGCCEKLLP